MWELGLRDGFPPVKLLNTLTSPFVLFLGSGVWASPEDGGIEARFARGRLRKIEELRERVEDGRTAENRRRLALKFSSIVLGRSLCKKERLEEVIWQIWWHFGLQVRMDVQ